MEDSQRSLSGSRASAVALLKAETLSDSLTHLQSPKKNENLNKISRLAMMVVPEREREALREALREKRSGMTGAAKRVEEVWGGMRPLRLLGGRAPQGLLPWRFSHFNICI